MPAIRDLTGPAALGTAASIGALFVAPPGIGMTGLAVFGGLLALAVLDDKPPAEPLHSVDSPAPLDLAFEELQLELEGAMDGAGLSILESPDWFVVETTAGHFDVEVNPAGDRPRVALPALVAPERLARWLAETADADEAIYTGIEDAEGWSPARAAAAAALAILRR